MDDGLIELTNGLQFPEGPIARPDGSVIFVEIARGTLSQWHPQTGYSVIADLGGGPNGAAIGPDGGVYVCNNGGFSWLDGADLMMPIGPATDYKSGSIQRVDLSTGEVATLYTHVGENALSGPNDIVFDRNGGMWFTDLGQVRARDVNHGGVYYAKADGSAIHEVVHPMHSPNGIGLSADEKTLYVAQTVPRLLTRFEITGPGEVAPTTGLNPGTAVGAQAPEHLLDSLALQSDGAICVGTIGTGGISTFDAASGDIIFTPMPDMAATNICFGGPDFKTAYITCSTTGTLISMPWPVAGHTLNFYDA
ncbi:MAG: SMP-30/gluconolactonase/LRE family protein [Pseudomonadota bacterium]